MAKYFHFSFVVYTHLAFARDRICVNPIFNFWFNTSFPSVLSDFQTNYNRIINLSNSLSYDEKENNTTYCTGDALLERLSFQSAR